MSSKRINSKTQKTVTKSNISTQKNAISSPASSSSSTLTSQTQSVLSLNHEIEGTVLTEIPKGRRTRRHPLEEDWNRPIPTVNRNKTKGLFKGKGFPPDWHSNKKKYGRPCEDEEAPVDSHDNPEKRPRLESNIQSCVDVYVKISCDPEKLSKTEMQRYFKQFVADVTRQLLDRESEVHENTTTTTTTTATDERVNNSETHAVNDVDEIRPLENMNLVTGSENASTYNPTETLCETLNAVFKIVKSKDVYFYKTDLYFRIPQVIQDVRLLFQKLAIKEASTLTDNPVWRTIHGHPITQAEISTLLHNKWLDDQVVVACFEKSCVEAQQVSGSKMKVVPLYLTQLLYSGESEGVQEFSDKVKTIISSCKGLCELVIPLRNEFHSYVVIADMKKTILNVFDSKQSVDSIYDLQDDSYDEVAAQYRRHKPNETLVEYRKRIGIHRQGYLCDILEDLVEQLDIITNNPSGSWKFKDDRGQCLLVKDGDIPIQRTGIPSNLLDVAYIQRLGYVNEAHSPNYYRMLQALPSHEFSQWLYNWLKLP